MTESDELASEIARALEIDWQYVRRVEAWDVEQVAELRKAGRRAGRILGRKIMTHQSSPRDDGRVVVIVVVTEAQDGEDAARMDERSRLLIERAFTSLDVEPGEE